MVRQRDVLDDRLHGLWGVPAPSVAFDQINDPSLQCTLLLSRPQIDLANVVRTLPDLKARELYT